VIAASLEQNVVQGRDTINGIVQLSGTVDNDRTRQRATELAGQVEGVRRVVSNLKVQG
jgi:osmotically-inducible protein OsmY